MRGAKLKGHSHRESTQGESWKTALDLTELGQKTARQKDNAPQIRKSNSLFLRVIVKNAFTGDDDNDVRENQSSQSQAHVTVFPDTENIVVKSQFN